MKFRCLKEYIYKIKKSINERKNYWVKYYDDRKDFHQKIAMVDYDPNDDQKLEKQMMIDLL
jgi:hypothetical protein